MSGKARSYIDLSRVKLLVIALAEVVESFFHTISLGMKIAEVSHI
jgi:hypothetical protein